VLGLGFEEFQRLEIDPDVQALIQQRNEARRMRDWKSADAIRDRLLAERSIQLMDSPDGTEWYALPKDTPQSGPNS
jgi:cysteinyl-tRNA synthetase